MIELNSFVLHRKKTAAKADSRGASRSAAKAAPAAAPGRNARRHGGAKRALPAPSCHDCLKKLAQKIPAGGGLPSVLLSNCSSDTGMAKHHRTSQKHVDTERACCCVSGAGQLCVSCHFTIFLLPCTHDQLSNDHQVLWFKTNYLVQRTFGPDTIPESF